MFVDESSLGFRSSNHQNRNPTLILKLTRKSLTCNKLPKDLSFSFEVLNLKEVQTRVQISAASERFPLRVLSDVSSPRRGGVLPGPAAPRAVLSSVRVGVAPTEGQRSAPPVRDGGLGLQSLPAVPPVRREKHFHCTAVCWMNKCLSTKVSFFMTCSDIKRTNCGQFFFFVLQQHCRTSYTITCLLLFNNIIYSLFYVLFLVVLFYFYKCRTMTFIKYCTITFLTHYTINLFYRIKLRKHFGDKWM